MRQRLNLCPAGRLALPLVALPLVLALVVLGALPGCSGGPDAPSEPPPPAADSSRTASADTAAPPPTATDRGRSVAERIADASLAARVKTALAENRELRTFDFDPRVTDGRLTLAGNVATRAQGRTAAEVAGEVNDVGDVFNRLTVDGQQVAWAQPESSEDEQTASSGGNAAPGPSDGAPGGSTYHTVRTGESLWAIASKYGTSVSRVRQLNEMRGNGLRPGERLLVRRGSGGTQEGGGGGGASAVADASGGSDAAVEEDTGAAEDASTAGDDASASDASREEDAVEYHVVERGESLWAIARENGMTVARLKELNSLGDDGLMPGDRLRVE